MRAVSGIQQSFDLAKIARKQYKMENFGMWDVAGLFGMQVVVVMDGSTPSSPPSPVG
jgi:hypothetical protein